MIEVSFAGWSFIQIGKLRFITSVTFLLLVYEKRNRVERTIQYRTNVELNWWARSPAVKAIWKLAARSLPMNGSVAILDIHVPEALG